MVSTIFYSILLTIPFVFITKEHHGFDYYAFTMNIETVIYLLLTIYLGRLTKLSLKKRSKRFAESIKKLNNYIYCDLFIHGVAFFGVMIPKMLSFEWTEETKDYILTFTVDAVSFSGVQINYIICDFRLI